MLDNIGPILSSQQGALQQGELQLSASGNSTIYNGNHIRYYEKILNNLTLTARVPIMSVLMGTLQGMVNNGSGSSDTASNIADAIEQVKDNLASPPLLAS